MDIYLIFATVLIIGTTVDSARILAVFPTPSISHHVVFRALTQELIRRGHEVVVITTDPAYPPGEAPINLIEIDMHNVSYHSWQKELLNADVETRSDLYKQMELYFNLIRIIFENQLQTEPIQNIIRNKNNVTFDLLLIELCVRPALAYYHVYKAPVITIASSTTFFALNEKLGAPTHPILYPEILRRRLYNLTYWETVKEFFHYYSMQHMFYSLEREENEMLKKYFGPDIPPLTELYNTVNMFFQNIYPVFMDYPPVPHSIVYMGGLHQKPDNEFPQDLSLYLNNSNNGVIYVSFGTNVNSSLLQPEKVQMMIKVFSNLPYNILWKMDAGTKELTAISKNIKIANWLPQSDLLKHPNIKAFIMQGGLQSTDEAITAGVPLIGIAMFGDQWFNVEKYVRHKIGIKLDWDSLTEEDFRTAILTITEDTSYRTNIRRFRSIINDQPQTPLERTIFWLEHVLKHGGAKHLRAPASNMSWAEYYELDLIIIVIISVIIALLSLWILLSCAWLRVSNIFLVLKLKVRKHL